MKLKNHWLIVVLALVAGLVGGAVSGWIFFMAESRGAVGTDIEIVKLFIQIGSAVVVAIGIVVSAVLVRKQMTATQDWNRRKATRDMLESFSKEFYDSETKLHKNAGVDFSAPGQTYNTFAGANVEIKLAIRNDLVPILVALERMACGIKYDIYDSGIAYDMYHPVLAIVYEWSKPFISNERGLPGCSKAYIELEQLYEIWEAPAGVERNIKLLAYQSKSLEDL